MNSMTNSPVRDSADDGSHGKVEIYTARHCGYCVRAKRLLQDKGIAFVEHAIDGDEEARRRMIERAGGRRTLPQIFIDDQAIGGFMELYGLERAGQLDALLLRGAARDEAVDQGKS